MLPRIQRGRVQGCGGSFCCRYVVSTDQDYVADDSQGRFKGLETMITSKIHIDDIVSKGFDELVSNKDQHIKILVTTDKVRL